MTAHLKCLSANAYSIGNRQGGVRGLCAIAGLLSHLHHRHGGIAHTTAVLQWVHSDFLGWMSSKEGSCSSFEGAVGMDGA